MRTLQQLEQGMGVLERAAVLMSIPLFTFSGYGLASGQAPQRLVRMAWLC